MTLTNKASQVAAVASAAFGLNVATDDILLMMRRHVVTEAEFMNRFRAEERRRRAVLAEMDGERTS